MNRKPSRKAMSKTELARWRRLLLEKREELVGDVTRMESQALTASDQDFSVDHMADHGSDNYEQDFTLGLIETEEETIREINAALERIESGTYGTCEECDGRIPAARLRAIPFARLCVPCQAKREEEGG